MIRTSASSFRSSLLCLACDRRLLTTRAPGRSAVSSLHQALHNSTFFLDNARWNGGLVVAGGVPAGAYGRVDENVPLEDRLGTPSNRFPKPPVKLLESPYPPPALEAYKAHPPLTIRRLLRVYSQLSKARLTTLIILTAMSGVALSPLPATIPVLLSTAIGTYLCSASANTFNQISEVPFDAQMARTRNRPLVRKVISPAHAAAFGTIAGISGVGILATCVNPTTAVLGAFNIWLYAGVYTPLKRISIVNTWIGAVVGAIPPVMGWTACGGHIFPSAAHPIQIFPPPFMTEAASALPLTDNPLAAFALFMLLFSWQFPHFNALAHLIRSSYAQAGYHMLSVSNPQHNALVALRHACLFVPICSILIPAAGLTSWSFAITSLVPNAVCVWTAWNWRATVLSGQPSDSGARKLWGVCLWWLPVILGLMMLHKKDSWWSQWIKGNAVTEEQGKQ